MGRGHLLDGRYKAKLVEGDDYLLSLSRYVHLNPVRPSAISSGVFRRNSPKTGVYAARSNRRKNDSKSYAVPNESNVADLSV